MSGRRDKNLRGGDIAESRGMAALQDFAAVAPVPRPEDVGIDAFATLLVADENMPRRLLAGDTFAVQFKAVSVEQLVYTADEIPWLRGVKLPFFLCRVYVKSNRFYLYSYLNCLADVSMLHRSGVDIRAELVYPLCDDDARHTLGPAILEWDLSMGSDPEFRKKAVAILSHWCVLLRHQLKWRILSMTMQVDWETNKIPSYRGDIMYAASDPLLLQGVIAECIDPLSALGYALGHHQTADLSPVLELMNKLLELHPNPIPHPLNDIIKHGADRLSVGISRLENLKQHKADNPAFYEQ